MNQESIDTIGWHIRHTLAKQFGEYWTRFVGGRITVYRQNSGIARNTEVFTLTIHEDYVEFRKRAKRYTPLEMVKETIFLEEFHLSDPDALDKIIERSLQETNV